MPNRTNPFHPSCMSRARILVLASVSAMLLAGPQVHADGESSRHLNIGRLIVGGWYLALDAGPFDPTLAGLSLSGLAHFHSDRTFMLSDASDFGAQSFPEPQATPQYGVWRLKRSWQHRGKRRIVGTTLFLAGDKETGEAIGWTKAQFDIHIVNKHRVEGTINVFSLPCENLLPIPSPLTCPDPIANADAFMPAGPPDVPITLRRIVAGK